MRDVKRVKQALAKSCTSASAGDGLSRREVLFRASTLGAIGIGLAGLSRSGQASVGLHADLVVDKATGFAIYGYDPVAYFDQGKALMGEHGMELRWHGAFWRFRHEGNRAAFKSNPEIYAPKFGGHDPLQLARGYTVEGSPMIWMIMMDRLYMFQSIVNLRIWETQPLRYAEQAQHNWDRLRVDGVGLPDPAISRLFDEN